MSIASEAKHHPCGVLLAVQLLAIVVYPALGESSAGKSALGVLGLVVLVVAVYAVRSTPALTWVAAILGVPVLVLTVMEAVWPHAETVQLWSALFHTGFYAYTAYALIRYMFSDDVVTGDELFATGATFTVVAWGFAYLFTATQLIWTGAFAGSNGPGHLTWVELLFLSVTTLTSTGLSDIYPVEPFARSFLMLEQIAGMLYLALVVARVTALISNRGMRRPR